MGTGLITPSTKKLEGDNAIVLSLIFGVVYVGLGNTYLGLVDPSADPLALAMVLFVTFCGWLGFLIPLRARWKAFGVLSFPSHVIVTLGLGVVSSAITWPLSIAVMYSSRFGSVLAFVLVCAFFGGFVTVLTYAAYTLALRSMNKRRIR